MSFTDVFGPLAQVPSPRTLDLSGKPKVCHGTDFNPVGEEDWYVVLP